MNLDNREFNDVLGYLQELCGAVENMADRHGYQKPLCLPHAQRIADQTHERPVKIDRLEEMREALTVVTEHDDVIDCTRGIILRNEGGKVLAAGFNNVAGYLAHEKGN